MKLSIVAIALLSALSATASAEGYYWGAAIGQSYSNLCPSTDKTLYSCANTGDAFGVSGGYNFTPNISIEVDYQILGTIAAYQSANSGSDGAASSNTKVNALEAAAIGNMEITKNLSLIGKLGIADIMLNQPSAAGTNTATNVNIIYGLGIQYDFSKSVAGRALWENLGSVGDASTGESRMSMISGGLVFKY
jgi:opacity protein-like surface antigen